MKVKHITQLGHPTTVTPDATLGMAASLMKEHHISGLPVVDEENKLQGIISLGQVVHEAQEGFRDPMLLAPEWHSPVMTRPTKRDWESVEVSRAMIRNVICVRPDDDCGSAARVLLDAGVHRAVVIDDKQHPVGMLTTLDFTSMVAESPLSEETS